jgi:hypothetical protein
LAVNRGSITGPTYGLGTITVVTPGTLVPLSGNSTINSGFGTTASPSPAVCNQIRVHAKNTNDGNFYLVHRGGIASTTENIALVVEPGTTEVLSVPHGANPFEVASYQADADTAGNSAVIVLVIV